MKRMGLLILLLGMWSTAWTQSAKVEVRGTVMDDDGEPAVSIIIRDKDEKGEVYGITDLDGKFKINADPNTTLHFSGLTYQAKLVKLKGKQVVNVVMSYESQMLNEVVVTAKKVVNKILPEQTDIEIKGNQCIIRPRVKIPKEMFKSSSRVIVQPVLIETTSERQRPFRPAVVTGRKYAITLERMYGFDPAKDPLAPYCIKSQRVDGGEMISYTDSLYLEDLRGQYRCDIFIFLVNYRKVTYKDTTVIAKGTINPMRFFTYKAGGSHLTDAVYLPKPQKQQRDGRGEARLTFRVNSPQMDDNPENTRELEKILKQLREIEEDPNAEFQSFSITGISSPEGSYAGNRALAMKRTQSMLASIMGHLKPGTVSVMKYDTRTLSKVASWEEVAALAASDSPLMAQEIREIVSGCPYNPDAQSAAITKLPYYQTVIKEKYLPRLRRVEYGFGYSTVRNLTDEEIGELYRKDYKQLMKYEFWRMYERVAQGEKERICRQALEVHPDFMLLANELSILLMEKGKPDGEVLAPFVREEAPTELLCNQIVTLLAEQNYTGANELVGWLPGRDGTQEIKAIVKAYNGQCEEAYELFARQGGVNEVVLLMTMKRDEEAYEKAMELPESGMGDYLRAACANRLEKVSDAYAYIKRALNKEPGLRKVAYVDGDVSDLVQQLDEAGKEEKNEK